MKEFSVSVKEKVSRIDFVVLFCVLGMNLLSILCLAGVASELGSRYVLIQTIASMLGLACMFIISFIDYDAIIKRYWKYILLTAVVLMVAVILFGKGERGNKAWLRIPGVPFDIQPSEFCKLLFSITFAYHIKHVQDKINNIISVLGLAIHGGLFFGLVLLTGDLGSGLIYLSIIGVMLLVSGLSMWYFIGVAAALVILSPILWSALSEVQQNRILFGFNPELDPQGAGFQALFSRRVIAAGGFLGSGFLGGTQYIALPDCHTDFIFAVLAEKFGFFGCFIYIALMTVLIIRILWIARIARKDYGAYICAGVVAVLMFQTLENVGMCLAMLPVIGITLPFMSYGGSSILSMYLMIGAVQSIKSHNRKYFFERENS